MLAGPFNDSNTNRVYHKTFKVECPYEGKRRCVNFFYRQRSGPPPSDIKCCPPCAHLVNISTPHTLIASAHANQGSHPVGVDREEIGGGDGIGDKRGNASKIDDREGGEDGGEGRGDEDMIFQSVLFNKDETTLSDVPSNTVRSRYWESKEAANLFGFQYDRADWHPG